MKSRRDIEMNFSRAVSQAQELEEISKELSTIASAHMSGALEMLSIYWKGDNSTAFNEKGKILTDEMLNTADDIIKVAKSIRSTAGLIYNAEKVAYQLGL